MRSLAAFEALGSLSLAHLDGLIAWIDFCQGKIPEALETFRKITADADPGMPIDHLGPLSAFHAYAAQAADQLDEAREVARTAVGLWRKTEDRVESLGLLGAACQVLPAERGQAASGGACRGGRRRRPPCSGTGAVHRRVGRRLRRGEGRGVPRSLHPVQRYGTALVGGTRPHADGRGGRQATRGGRRPARGPPPIPRDGGAWVASPMRGDAPRARPSLRHAISTARYAEASQSASWRYSSSSRWALRTERSGSASSSATRRSDATWSGSLRSSASRAAPPHSAQHRNSASSPRSPITSSRPPEGRDRSDTCGAPRRSRRCRSPRRRLWPRGCRPSAR